MVIRCPHCQFSRSITLDKIPATAEIATCPKCKQRFRFRTLPKKIVPETYQNPDANEQPHGTPQEEFSRDGSQKSTRGHAKKHGKGHFRKLDTNLAQDHGHEHDSENPHTSSPQTTKKQSAKKDIWDALSSFGKLLDKEKETTSASTASDVLEDHMHGSQASDAISGIQEHQSPLHSRQGMPHDGGAETVFDHHTPSPATGPATEPADDHWYHDASDAASDNDAGTSSRRPTPPSYEPEEDVEIYIHYVDGKPTSFRNPWAKKLSPQEEAQHSREDTQYAPAVDNELRQQTDSPDQPLPDRTLPDNAFTGEDTEGEAPLRVRQPYAQTSEYQVEYQAEQSAQQRAGLVYDEAGHEGNAYGSDDNVELQPRQSNAHDAYSAQDVPPYSQHGQYGEQAASYDPATYDNQADMRGEHQGTGDPDVAQDPATAKYTEKTERPLTPLEALAAQGREEYITNTITDTGAMPAEETPELSPAEGDTHANTPHNAPREGENTEHAGDSEYTENASAEKGIPSKDETVPTSSSEKTIVQSTEESSTPPPPQLPDMASFYETNKPFDYEDTPPEERVEKDLLLLQTSMERPTKDLGILREVQPENILDPFSETREIPWEHPKTYGVFPSLLRTIKNVMFSAPAFFRTMPPAGGMPFAFLFFILHGYLAVMCTTFWVILAAILFDIPALTTIQDAVPSIALFTPVGLSLLLIAATSCTRIFLILFQREQASFAFTFKLLSYAIAPLVLSIIPFIGPVAGLIWSFVILGTACHHSTGLSPIRSVITIIPTCLLVLGLFYLLF